MQVNSCEWFEVMVWEWPQLSRKYICIDHNIYSAPTVCSVGSWNITVGMFGKELKELFEHLIVIFRGLNEQIVGVE